MKHEIMFFNNKKIYINTTVCNNNIWNISVDTFKRYHYPDINTNGIQRDIWHENPLYYAGLYDEQIFE